MSAIPKILPLSDLRIRQGAVLEELAEGPVVLAQRGRPAAVLVSAERWNRLLERLEFLEDSLDAAEIRARIAAGEEKVSDLADLEAELYAEPE